MARTGPLLLTMNAPSSSLNVFSLRTQTAWMSYLARSMMSVVGLLPWVRVRPSISQRSPKWTV
jgi:hypothetical protein